MTKMVDYAYGLSEKRETVRKNRLRIWVIYICFYLAGAMIFRLFAGSYGKSLVHLADSKDQYLPFLRYLHDYYREMLRNLLHGDFHVKMFDYGLGCGLDSIRTVSYYGMADPLSFPVVFFKPQNILQYYQFIVQFRPFLAGASFIAMCFHFKKVRLTVPFCALFYLCSGWAFFAFSVHPFFNNFLILLPIVIIGIDRVLFGQSPALFIASIFLTGCIGFYFLFLVSIGLFFFAAVRLSCNRETLLAGSGPVREEAEQNTGFDKGGIDTGVIVIRAALMVLKCLGFYLIGLAMSCFILLPSLLGFMDTIRGASSNLPDHLIFYSLPKLAQMFSQAVFLTPGCDSISFSMLGLFSLIAVLMKQYRKEKGVLILIGIVLFLIPAWSVLLEGISMPKYRWFYMLSLLIMYCCVDLPDYLAESSILQKAVFVVSAAAVLVTCSKLYPDNKYYMLVLAVGAVSAAVLLLISRKSIGRTIRRNICLLLILLQCIMNTAVYFSPLWYDKVHEYTDRGAEYHFNEEILDFASNDSGYDSRYRTELGFSRAFNTLSFKHIPSTRVYGSIVPSTFSDFVLETEDNTMSLCYAVYGLDERAALMQLCSMGYFISTPYDFRDVPYGYEETYKDDKATVYTNKNAMSPGCVYYNTFDPADIEHRSGIEKQSLMLQGAVVDQSNSFAVQTDSLTTGVSEIPYEIVETNGISFNGNILSIEEGVDEPWMDIALKTPADSEIYARLEGVTVGEKLEIRFRREDGKIQSLYVRDRNWAYGQKDYSALIQWTGEGGEKNTRYRMYFIGANEYELDGLKFYAYDLKHYDKTAEELAENCMQDLRFGNNSISGSVECKRDGILCMSVPYSKGWTAYVDGGKAECIKANYLCTAVIVPEGRHEVTFRYKTPGLVPGSAASVIGLIFLIVLLKCRKSGSKHLG